ncbi:hypothetical protein [Acetobacter okinawensis]|uniref:hypothetical protein n=1 Tax=Acetobacter okinawensis TaxID=1076594 RepID=UPI0020A0BD95|nr:hypothetical protein [Acetobacter okinawensis]MCP1212342.1 hypothetical protein [Acetobacter okinawensis]
MNKCGEQAFIFHCPQNCFPINVGGAGLGLVDQTEVPLGFQAPLITQPYLDMYDAMGLTPIVIYPEIHDNPLNVPFFGRYILNYPGALAPQYQQKENFSVGYTKTLCDAVTSAFPDHPPCDDILFIPTCDLDLWKPPAGEQKRSGTCYYVGKLRAVHGCGDVDFSSLGTEILRDKKMSREEMRAIFQRSETLYCFEDSSVALEAKLCGCEVVFLPNKHFNGVGLAANELPLERDHEALRGTLQQYIADLPRTVGALAQKWQALADQAQPVGRLQAPLKTYYFYVN